ncbi:hypothetical protein H8959_012237 [Pygathrix nigripes]
MRSLPLLSAFCILAVALATEVKKPAATAAPGTVEKLNPKAVTLAERSAGPAFILYQAMAKDQAVENILVSPVVAASSLGLVSLGGKATTASQAKAVLSTKQLRDEEMHTGEGKPLRSLSNSTARNINFHDKRSALQSINEWATQTTDGKLPEVTKDVDCTDGALLVNAMFFKPHWDEKFHHKMVDNHGFMMTRSYTVVVMMMHQKGLYNYYDNKKEKLQIKHLSGLGLTEAIDKNKANLSHMPRKKDLYLASVFHTTAFELDTNGNPFDQDIYGHEELRSPKLFYSDHPFVFLVWDT